MSLTQSKVSDGLDNMPLNKRYPVKPGSLPFIEAHMGLLDLDGGIHLNSDRTEFYKTRLPELKNF